MICEKCKVEGLKSYVYVGCSSVTLMYSPSYYDKDGNYHSHDFNWSTTEYSCSNGHHFTVRSKMGCKTCGVEPEIEAVYYG